MTRWIVGFAVSLATGWPCIAGAEESGAVGLQGLERPRVAVADRGSPDVHLQIGGALEVDQPKAGGTGVGPLQWSTAKTAATANGAIAGLSLAIRPDEDGGSNVAVSVTRQFLVGLGYRQLQVGDPMRSLALADAVDRGDHALLVRAQWAF